MKEKEITGVCCICRGPIYGYGNNPEGAMWKTEEGDLESGEFDINDRCCDECNTKFVIPGRLYRMRRGKRND